LSAQSLTITSKVGFQTTIFYINFVLIDRYYLCPGSSRKTLHRVSMTSPETIN